MLEAWSLSSMNLNLIIFEKKKNKMQNFSEATESAHKSYHRVPTKADNNRLEVIIVTLIIGWFFYFFFIFYFLKSEAHNRLKVITVVLLLTRSSTNKMCSVDFENHCEGYN